MHIDVDKDWRKEEKIKQTRAHADTLKTWHTFNYSLEKKRLG